MVAYRSWRYRHTAAPLYFTYGVAACRVTLTALSSTVDFVGNRRLAVAGVTRVGPALISRPNLGYRLNTARDPFGNVGYGPKFSPKKLETSLYRTAVSYTHLTLPTIYSV